MTSLLLKHFYLFKRHKEVLTILSKTAMDETLKTNVSNKLNHINYLLWRLSQFCRHFDSYTSSQSALKVMSAIL